MNNSQDNNFTPLVTVNLLSYNRKDELRNTLIKVFGQDYKNIEVIVIDNASNDHTINMLRSEFPQVRCFRLKKNIGISGYNIGFKKAKGKYILLLDDDSYPLDETIFRGVNRFKENKKLGIIAYKILNSRLNIVETKDLNDKPLSFIGCGALISNQLFQKIGYFNTNNFIYFNELELSARCYDAGYEINYLNDAVVIHRQHLGARGKEIVKDPYISKFRYYHSLRSYNVFLIQNFNLKSALKNSIKWWVNRAIIAVVYLYFVDFLKGISWVIYNWRRLRSTKKILSKEVQFQYNYGNIPLIDRTFFKNF